MEANVEWIRNFYRRWTVTPLGWTFIALILVSSIRDYGLIGILYTIIAFILLTVTSVALNVIDPKNYPKKQKPNKPKLYEEDSHDW